MQSTESGVVTAFVGTHYEVRNPSSGETITKYYYAGATRIASRKYTIPQSMAVEYLLGDHLGSASITTDSSGDKVSEIRYREASLWDKPWGEVRYAWKDPNLSTTPAFTLTKYTLEISPIRIIRVPLLGVGLQTRLLVPRKSVPSVLSACCLGSFPTPAGHHLA